MQDLLYQILSDIRRKTGIDVRLCPRGDSAEETRFTLRCPNGPTEVYVDGGEAETEKLRALIQYLADNAFAVPDKRQLLRSILLGEGGEWQAFRFMTKYSVADAPCCALDLVPEKKTEQAAAHIEQCLDGDLSVMMDGRIAVVRFEREGQSAYEFGQFLSRTIYEEIGVKASVGTGMEVKSFSEISASYQQAVTATRMSALFGEKGDVHLYREYLLARMIEDVPKHKLNEYLKQFRVGNAAEIFEDKELAETAEEFLENSLNLSETARNLFLHRNTLGYRLEKIERTTGLDIRKFSDAVTYRVLSVLYRLLQS